MTEKTDQTKRKPDLILIIGGLALTALASILILLLAFNHGQLQELDSSARTGLIMMIVGVAAIFYLYGEGFVKRGLRLDA